MNRFILTLLKPMLAELQEKYSCASCNDFNLATYIPDREARHEIMKKVFAANDVPERYKSDDDYKIVSDGMLLRWIRRELFLTNP